ncbi:Uncharacterised protein [Klebsiella variicola]|nr:Uncharacterised protein [Klebsiella variicola]SXE77136.1 Uncharacterised protein [Klebsiella variicola]
MHRDAFFRHCMVMCTGFTLFQRQSVESCRIRDMNSGKPIFSLSYVSHKAFFPGNTNMFCQPAQVLRIMHLRQTNHDNVYPFGQH